MDKAYIKFGNKISSGN